jgi:2-polyprenyl-3-methyl-5-hydroxy-6-metoxy-1,4-benzoquinol methylase
VRRRRVSGIRAKRTLGIELHGYDPNEDAVRLARSELEARGIAATIHAAVNEITDAYSGVVVCADVLEHVHEAESVLADLHRVLEPGGKAVVTTPVRLTEHRLTATAYASGSPRSSRSSSSPDRLHS